MRTARVLKLSQIKQELSGSVSLTSLSLREDDDDYAPLIVAGSDNIDSAKEEYGLSREEIAADMRMISGQYFMFKIISLRAFG